ncbi:MAG: 4-hydroxy-tetrahydrodipicolinate synthase, partial [Acetobacter orientalis]
IEDATSGGGDMGTPAATPTLPHPDHHAVVERAIKIANGRVPVIAGAGSNSTSEAVDLAKHAEKAGAAAALVVTPYYNKPTQEGLYRHFMAVADAISIPVILYNIPGRSVVDISVETTSRLARHANIIGVKDATANLLRPLQVRQAVAKPFNQLSGEDGTAVAFLAAGGDGCISVTSNIAPALCAEVQKAWQQGECAKAIALQDKLLPLHDALFC